MKNIIKKYFAFTVPFIFLLASCENVGDTFSKEITLRTAIESENSDIAVIKVYIEGADGNLVSGALITDSNSQNSISNNINWNSDKDGFLGNGNNIKVYLSSGLHVISARHRETDYSVLIEVKKIPMII